MTPITVLNDLGKALADNHQIRTQKALKELYVFSPMRLLEPNIVKKLDSVLNQNLTHFSDKKWFKVLDFCQNKLSFVSYEELSDILQAQWIKKRPNAAATIAGHLQTDPVTTLEKSNRRAAVTMLERAIARNDEQLCSEVLSLLPSTTVLEPEFAMKYAPTSQHTADRSWVHHLFPLYSVKQLKMMVEECGQKENIHQFLQSMSNLFGNGFISSLFNAAGKNPKEQKDHNALTDLIMPLSNADKKMIIDQLNDTELNVLKTHNELFNTIHQQMLFSLETSDVSSSIQHKRKI